MAQQNYYNDTLKIKSKTVWIKVIHGKKELNYRQKELRYNEDGRLIEEAIFNMKNRILSHKAFIYEKGLLIHEFEFDIQGRIILRTDFVYKNGTLMTRKIYDGKGKLIKTEENIFEYFD
jgi:hypothetical protein